MSNRKFRRVVVGMKISNRLRGLGGLFRSGRSVVLLSVMVMAVIGGTAAFTIWHNRQSELEQHQRDMNSMGVVLAEQTSRYAEVIDLILREVQSRVAGLNVSTPADYQRQSGTQEVHNYLAERSKNVPQVAAIDLIDANGLVVNWSRSWPVARVDSSDRDFYNYFKEHDDPGLFIGSLSKNRGTGNLSLFLARRINGAPRTDPCERDSRIRLLPRVFDGKTLARPGVKDAGFREPISG
jgi:hypothetical protein